MKTITLTPKQLAHLEREGELIVVEVMREQPFKWSRNYSVPQEAENWIIDTKLGLVYPPALHAIGDRVECEYSASVTDMFGGIGIGTLTVPATVTTCEPVMLRDVTEEEAEMAGYRPLSFTCPPRVFSHRAALLNHLQSTHPDLTPDSYVWLTTIRKEG